MLLLLNEFWNIFLPKEVSGKLRAGVCLWISGADTTEHNGGKGKDTLGPPLWSRNVGQQCTYSSANIFNNNNNNKTTFKAIFEGNFFKAIISTWQKGNWASDYSFCHSSIAGWTPAALNTCSISCLYGINVSRHQSIRIRISIEAIDRRVRCVPDMSTNYSSVFQKHFYCLGRAKNNCLYVYICDWNWFVPVWQTLHYFQLVCGRKWTSFNWSILVFCPFSSWLHCTYCLVGNKGKFMQSQKLENKVCGVWLQ